MHHPTLRDRGMCAAELLGLDADEHRICLSTRDQIQICAYRARRELGEGSTEEVDAELCEVVDADSRPCASTNNRGASINNKNDADD